MGVGPREPGILHVLAWTLPCRPEVGRDWHLQPHKMPSEPGQGAPEAPVMTACCPLLPLLSPPPARPGDKGGEEAGRRDWSRVFAFEALGLWVKGVQEWGCEWGSCCGERKTAARKVTRRTGM